MSAQEKYVVYDRVTSTDVGRFRKWSDARDYMRRCEVEWSKSSRMEQILYPNGAEVTFSPEAFSTKHTICYWPICYWPKADQ